MAGEVFFPDGFWGEAAADAPTTPTLSVSVSGTTATATIDGDAGVTNFLVYKAAGETSWSAGGSRSGDGDIAVADLIAGVRYVFIAYSLSSGTYSTPSVAYEVLIQVSTTGAQDALLANEASMFLAQFGESVTYYPKGGGSRDIVAVVDRNPVSGLNGMPHGNSPKFVISVKNSADDGISSSEINDGGDKIGFSVRIGEAATQRRVQSIQWHDVGMLYLAVA